MWRRGSMNRRASKLPQPRRNGRPAVAAQNGHAVSQLPIFDSQRPPRSMWSGLEPVFLLLDADLMRQLRAKAAASGTAYDFLLKTILRDHLDEY